MKRLLRADLSGPVLAIIITVAIIAAGLGLAAYFWWLAPQASKTPTLSIIGEPALTINGSTWTLYITVKNTGTENIIVKYAVIKGVELKPSNTITLKPGEKLDIALTATNVAVSITEPSIEGTLVTDGGVYPFNAYVISS